MTEYNREVLDAVEALLAPLKFWKLNRILGAGGAGYVLDVEHSVLRSRRAMKFIHASLLRSPVMRDRFETEARIAYMLDHPNIVKAHEMGVVGETPYIVMDLVTGGSLEDHLNTNGKMPPRQAVQVAIAALRGLQAAHDQGVVHRDVKPQNLLFTEMGILKIIDFGIARVMDATRGHTRAGSTMGTWAYMSPEQLHGEVDLIDHRSDVHAVGVTLYKMLTMGNLGQSAFHEQIREHPERLDGIAETLQMVIRKATAKNREDRFETASSMADELELRIALGEIPVDPSDTPALGSAPAVKARKDQVLDAPDPQKIQRMGATMVPGATHAQPEYEEEAPSVSSQGIIFKKPLERSASLTIHPVVDMDAEAAELAAIRQAAKRRFYRRVVLPVVAVFGLVLVVCVGVWFATRPAPIVEAEPIAETVIDTVVEPVVPVVIEPLPTLEVAPIVEPVPEPIPAPAVKSSSTPRVVVRPPLPEPAVTVEHKAQVNLVIKPDTTATVTLSGDGGTFTLTGGSREVPQGTYRVSIDLLGREAPQMGTLTVTPGLTTITCDSRFRMCTGLK